MGKQLLKHREALLAAVIVLLIGAIGSRAPSFVSPGNLVEMFNDTAILIVLALGQMMVLLTKGIDLSMVRQSGADRDDRRAAQRPLSGYPGGGAAGAGDPAWPADGDD